MNPMDQAFIKAYAKDKSAPAAPASQHPPVNHPVNGYGAPHTTAVASYATPAYAPGTPVSANAIPPMQWTGGQGLRVEAAPAGPWNSGIVPHAHVSFPSNQFPGYPPAYATNGTYAPAYAEPQHGPQPTYPQYGPSGGPHVPSGYAPANIAPPMAVPEPVAPESVAPKADVPHAVLPAPTAPPIDRQSARPALKSNGSWATTAHDSIEIDVTALAAEWLPPVEVAPPRPVPVESIAKIEPAIKQPLIEPTSVAINALDTAMASEELIADPLAARYDTPHAPLAGPHFVERARPAIEEVPQSPVPMIETPQEPDADSLTAAPPQAEVKMAEPLPDKKADLASPPAHEAGFDELAAPLLAVWEVDRFQWPDSAMKLHREYSYFAQAGKKLKAAAEQGLKVLGVTGLSRGEGRTLLTLCLARSAAAEGINAVVIDADFKKPDLAGALGLEVSAGWQEASLGKISLAETAIYSIDDRLTLLPLTGDVKKFSLRDRRVQAVVREASRLFDVVLLDLGPLDEMGDDAWSAENRPPLDAAIVVCDLRQHQLDEVREAAVKLQAAGVEAVGIAENFSSAAA